jgi:hypothetical protein
VCCLQVDIYLNFRTGFISEGHFVSDDWLVAKTYLEGAFFADVLGTFPLNIVQVHQPSPSPSLPIPCSTLPTSRRLGATPHPSSFVAHSKPSLEARSTKQLGTHHPISPHPIASHSISSSHLIPSHPIPSHHLIPSHPIPSHPVPSYRYLPSISSSHPIPSQMALNPDNPYGDARIAAMQAEADGAAGGGGGVDPGRANRMLRLMRMAKLAKLARMRKLAKYMEPRSNARRAHPVVSQRTALHLIPSHRIPSLILPISSQVSGVV